MISREKLRRARAIFNQAITLESEQRVAFLERICGKDTALLWCVQILLYMRENNLPGLEPQSSKTLLNTQNIENHDEQSAAEPEPQTEPGTLKGCRATLTHVMTGRRFEIMPEPKVHYIGRYNEQQPLNIDLTSLPGVQYVSRLHAVLYQEGGSFFLEDAGSRNGTYVNGKSIQAGIRYRYLLREGDIVVLGNSTKMQLRFDLSH